MQNTQSHNTARADEIRGIIASHTDPAEEPENQAQEEAAAELLEELEILEGATATYSPEDNKLRLYPMSRLDADTYAKVKAAGFKWAPKQELFVAPMWTPSRADLLAALCGEIGDEDTSLVDRAEERADRFEVYSDKRANDGDRAHAAVQSITKNIPLGQPILIGHHSERHARRDAKRIENGMRRAVDMWETSTYWTRRAAGALHAAKYKERPDVRARRIKGIEADKRKQQRNKEDSELFLRLWNNRDFLKKKGTDENAPPKAWAMYIANRERSGAMRWSRLDRDEITPDEAQAEAIKQYTASIAWSERWIAHCTNRLAYETAMLEEQGATQLLAKKPKPKQLPLCNYQVPDGLEVDNPYHRGTTIRYPIAVMTSAEYAAINKDYKGTRTVGHSHRVRVAMMHNPPRLVYVFLSDSKTHEPPHTIEPELPPPPAPRANYQPPQPSEAAQKAKDVRAQLREGIQVAVAPQLFPTPPDIAARMVELADISTGQTLLEPSAGTGRLLHAVRAAGVAVVNTAVELNHNLANRLRLDFDLVRQGDFLQLTSEDLGMFDRILMNPPFINSADIKHIMHAAGFLKPGGRLVAICADGPRQREQLQPLSSHWETLPAGTFKDQGTNVSTALLIIEG